MHGMHSLPWPCWPSAPYAQVPMALKRCPKAVVGHHEPLKIEAYIVPAQASDGHSNSFNASVAQPKPICKHDWSVGSE